VQHTKGLKARLPFRESADPLVCWALQTAAKAGQAFLQVVFQLLAAQMAALAIEDQGLHQRKIHGSAAARGHQ